MHMVGVVLLTICPIILGFAFAKNLKRAKEELLSVIAFIDQFKTMIRFERRELSESLSALSRDPQLAPLTFLTVCLSYLKKGMAFPQAWEKAVMDWKCQIDVEDQNRLASLSGILGACDVQGQVDSLLLLQQDFERSYQRQQELVQTQGKLFRSLGILAAIGLFVLII